MIQVAKKTTLQKYFPQLVAGLGVTMVLVQLGLSSGWSSPYLPKLQHPDSALRLTADEASWVASLLNLGRFCGAFCGALSVNYCGTKRTMLFNLIPVSMCWILTIMARDAWWLYAARFSGGLGLGMTYSSFPLYLGEVSFPEIRGSLVSMASCGGTFGVMLSNIAGKYLAMEVSASIYLAPCLVFIALFWWLPESPHYLIKKKDFKAAKASISWYRADYNVEEEFESVQQFISAAKEQSFTEKLAEFKKPAIRRATILVILLWTFMQICGFNNVLFYMVQILQDSKVNNPEDFAMYVSAAGVAASTLSITLVAHRFEHRRVHRSGRPRRPLPPARPGGDVPESPLAAHHLALRLRDRLLRRSHVRAQCRAQRDIPEQRQVHRRLLRQSGRSHRRVRLHEVLPAVHRPHGHEQRLLHARRHHPADSALRDSLHARDQGQDVAADSGAADQALMRAGGVPSCYIFIIIIF
ncbi:unnamed protein product [Trichogramma brassicae]|uniref:Major facilitator superfamily (MFS) profile domain-containing protein n=1 Tax=Trichogramma brassicae TaxID=86971 RepID=A0A6H5IEM8_9HYME|nr:unnamed protein product [Trichogramma brassicae]